MAQIKLNSAPARQFLTALYGRFFSQGQAAAFLEVRGKREGQGMSFRRFYRNPETLLKDMTRWQPGLNYWVGVALRRDNRGGAKADLLALTAAFADVDVGAAGHKAASHYQTKAEALAAIEAFPLRPSVVVDSGGGFQPYWLFREPVQLSPETITRLEGINRGLAQALGGDVAATDAARILRLPGTFNMKLAGQPRPVKIIWCEPDRAFDLAELAKFEGKGQAKGRRQSGAQAGTPAPPGAVPGGDYAAYAQKALADELAQLSKTPEGERNARLNQAAFALGQLVEAGVLDRGSVEAALYGVALSIGLGEAEARATIKSGIESGMKEPRRLPEKAQERGNRAKQGKGSASLGKGRQAGQDETEAEKIWWVGHCYLVERGRLCLEKCDREMQPYTVTLSNFQARIEEEITRDDGLKTTREFQVTGSLDTGQGLPSALVLAEKFDSLAWIKKEWGAAASVAPGRSLGPHLANAIQAHSQGCRQCTVYAHTGWRKINGSWRYLHGGGGIGPGEPVEVELGEGLGNYRLPEPGGLEAAQASLSFLDTGPWEVTAPLLAAVYLAPFADLCRINFSLWLYGPSGSFKSTLAALALSHFGNFDVRSLPGNWLSTVNSLERLTFALKDTLCVIDDFTPPATGKEHQVQMEKAGRLVYQAGNRSARGRLAADLKARPNYYPRGLIISTGEMLLPGQRQSATARYLGIEFDQKKSPIDKARLTGAQQEAHLYAAAMAAFLSDLAPRLEDAQAEIKDLWEGYRTAFRGGGHLRTPEIQAWLAIGFEMFLRFQVRMGSINGDQSYEMLKRAWKVFEALGEKHGKIIEGERPTQKFLDMLNELFLTSRIKAESAGSSHLAKGAKPPKEYLLGWTGSETDNAYLAGYADETMLYLLPDAAFKAVNEAIRAQGEFLSLGKNEMLRALAREGLIEPDRNGKNTQIKWIQGGSKRVICLPRAHLGHDEPRPEGGE
jgi:hypothetical protein